MGIFVPNMVSTPSPLSPLRCKCWLDGDGLPSKAEGTIQFRVTLASLSLVHEPHKPIALTDPLLILYHCMGEIGGGEKGSGGGAPTSDHTAEIREFLPLAYLTDL